MLSRVENIYLFFLVLLFLQVKCRSFRPKVYGCSLRIEKFNTSTGRETKH